MRKAFRKRRIGVSPINKDEDKIEIERRAVVEVEKTPLPTVLMTPLLHFHFFQWQAIIHLHKGKELFLVYATRVNIAYDPKIYFIP